MNHTSEQLLILEAGKTLPHSMCIQAVAGSGKTTTLVELAKVLPPSLSILALAFNKSIAEELSRRLPSHIQCSTLNSLGHRAIASRLRKKLKLDTGKLLRLAEKSYPVKNLVEKAKSQGLGLPFLEDTQENWESLSVQFGIPVTPEEIDQARRVLRESNAEATKGTIDFNDQLYIPAVHKWKLDSFDVVLLDEAQDLSPLQHLLVSSALGVSGKVIICGDKHQAIYAWRGAHSNSMELLSQKYAAKEYSLTTSFRCAKKITEEARKIVPSIHSVPEAETGNVEKLDSWKLPDLYKGGGKSLVVLCRNNSPLIRLGFKLIKSNQPARFANKDYFRGLQTVGRKLEEPLSAGVHSWKEGELQRAKNSSQKSLIEDRAETLSIIIENTGCVTKAQLIDALEHLTRNEDGITLSTIHGAKGLEWTKVFFLDPHLIPSKYAEQEWELEQERNLTYIGITRAKEYLTYITSGGLNE